MAKVNPTHSVKPQQEVYHNNDKCTERNNIEKENLRTGTAGRRLCSKCQRLNEEGK